MPIRLLPYITGVWPSSGGVNMPVIINGVNFFGITGVRFNGVAAEFTVNNITQITTKVPAGATTGLITVSQSCSSFTSPSQFTVTP
jgi:hypothetical protein